MKESLTLTYLPWRNPWPWESIWWGRSWWWRSPWVEGWRCRGSVCASRTRRSCRWYVHLGEALGPTPRPPWRTRSPSAAAKKDWKIKSSQLSHHESPTTKNTKALHYWPSVKGIPQSPVFSRWNGPVICSASLVICERNPPVSGGFPWQRAINAKSISTSCHHGICRNKNVVISVLL